MLKLVTRLLQRPPRPGSAPATVFCWPASTRCRSRSRSCAERRVVDERAVAVGRLPVLDRVVEALGAAAGERLRVLAQEGLEVLARVALQRGQQVAELDRRRRLGDRDRVAVVELRRRRRARLEVDEEVALEEDARPDLELGVALQRQALVLASRSSRARRPARPRRGSTALTLPDLDARDPHGRARLEVVHVVEDGRELERVRERVRLGEAEDRCRAPVTSSARSPARKMVTARPPGCRCRARATCRCRPRGPAGCCP